MCRSVTLVALLLVVPFLSVSCVTEMEQQEKDPDEYTEAPRFLKYEIEERIAALEFQTDEQLYQNMMRLVYIGEPAVPFIIDGLQNKAARIRASCAWILGVLRDRRTIEPLQGCLDDEAPVVRYEAATSLGIMGVRDAYPVLIEGLKDPEIRYRYKAHEALQMLTKQSFGYKHDDAPEVRAQAVARWESWYRRMADSQF
jgi:HEAT repeat protein